MYKYTQLTTHYYSSIVIYPLLKGVIVVNHCSLTCCCYTLSIQRHSYFLTVRKGHLCSAVIVHL